MARLTIRPEKTSKAVETNYGCRLWTISQPTQGLALRQLTLEQSGQISERKFLQSLTAAGAHPLSRLRSCREQRGESTKGVACNHNTVTLQRQTLMLLCLKNSGQILKPLLQSLCAIKRLSTLQQGLHGSSIAAWMLQDRNRPTARRHTAG